MVLIPLWFRFNMFISNYVQFISQSDILPGVMWSEIYNKSTITAKFHRLFSVGFKGKSQNQRWTGSQNVTKNETRSKNVLENIFQIRGFLISSNYFRDFSRTKAIVKLIQRRLQHHSDWTIAASVDQSQLSIPAAYTRTIISMGFWREHTI